MTRSKRRKRDRKRNLRGEAALDRARAESQRRRKAEVVELPPMPDDGRHSEGNQGRSP